MRKGLRLLDGASFAFASGVRQTQQLQVPSTFIKRIYVWLRGTLTISVVTVPGAPHLDGPANLISNIEVLLDGKPWKFGSAPSFLRLAQRWDKTDGVNDGLVSGAAGVYNFEALIPLMAEIPRSVSPIDTLIDGRALKNITMNLTWGTTGSLIVGNTSTLAITNGLAEIYIDETDAFPVGGGQGFWLFRENEVTQGGVITSGATRVLLPYNRGSVYPGIQIRAIDGSDLSDAIINRATLRINGGQELPFNNLEDDFLQAMAKHATGSDAMPDGYYHMELAENGLFLTTGLGAGEELNSVELLADTTVGVGATSLVAHMLELVPPGR